MKTTIIATVLGMAAIFGALHVRQSGGPVVSTTPALESSVAPTMPRDPVEFTSSVVEVPEVTIVGIVPAKRHESDAAHMARLIAAPMHCGDFVATMGTGEISGTSGNPRVAYCR